MMNFLLCLLILVCVLISVAFLTLIERKILGLVGLRYGPNKVFFMGLFQPFSDALKLGCKQVNLMSNFSFFFYYVSCFILLFCSLLIWSVYWINPIFCNFKLSLIIFFIVLSVNSVNSILSGWSTFGKYSILGSLRSVAQLISYESCLYFCLFFFIFSFESFSLFYFSEFDGLMYFIILPICFYIWIPSFLAELNRTPFDFSEGESELVSGFNIDFGSSAFTLIFLSEYSNIIFFSLISSFIFFSGSFLNFFIILIFVIWIRSVLPRFRFDKLMTLCWTFFVPILTLYFVSFVVLIF